MDHVFKLKRDDFDERDFLFAHAISPLPTIKLPSQADLRYKCPPVYEQGELGSCTANAACACRSMLLSQPRLLLSRLFLYYKGRVVEGTVEDDSGACIRDICKAARNFGICEEKFMPYDAEKFKDEPSKDAVENAIKYRIIAYRKLNSINEIKQNLALRQQPVLTGMDVYESFMSDKIAKTGVMRMPKASEKNLGGHAVLIVGYKDNQNTINGNVRTIHTSKGYFIVRNSWGTNWGDHGYFYMPYEYAAKGHAFDFWTME